MGILDRLFGGRFTMPPPEETNLSASAIMKELRPGHPIPHRKRHSRLLPERCWLWFRKKKAPDLSGASCVDTRWEITHAVPSQMDCWMIQRGKNLNTSF